MADFNIRSDSVNVEQIMQQIRARIREKRGVDYTEQQIRELAAVKLETFLNPHAVRSGLLEQFREGGVSPFENYAFEDSTLFESHRAPLRWIRRLLRPFLKLFYNLDRLIAVLHVQSKINTKQSQFSQVSFELLHNLVVETTRLGIEVKNLKMRVESLSSRYDFAERRARALEGLVQARLEGRGDEQPAPRGRGQQQPPAQGRGSQSQPPQGRGPQNQPPQARGAQGQGPQPPAAQAVQAQGEPGAAAPAAAGRDAESPGDARRRRRRRRGRRSGAGRPGAEGAPAETTPDGETDGADESAAGPGALDGAREAPEGDRTPEDGQREDSGGDAGGHGNASGSLPFPDREDQ
jgi:hypothetical protein